MACLSVAICQLFYSDAFLLPFLPSLALFIFHAYESRSEDINMHGICKSAKILFLFCLVIVKEHCPPWPRFTFLFILIALHNNLCTKVLGTNYGSLSFLLVLQEETMTLLYFKTLC